MLMTLACRFGWNFPRELPVRMRLVHQGWSPDPRRGKSRSEERRQRVVLLLVVARVPAARDPAAAIEGRLVMAEHVAATRSMARSVRRLGVPPGWLDLAVFKRQRPGFVNASPLASPLAAPLAGPRLTLAAGGLSPLRGCQPQAVRATGRASAAPARRPLASGRSAGCPRQDHCPQAPGDWSEPASSDRHHRSTAWWAS